MLATDFICAAHPERYCREDEHGPARPGHDGLGELLRKPLVSVTIGKRGKIRSVLLEDAARQEDCCSGAIELGELGGVHLRHAVDLRLSSGGRGDDEK